jgi:hypothetical protein
MRATVQLLSFLTLIVLTSAWESVLHQSVVDIAIVASGDVADDLRMHPEWRVEEQEVGFHSIPEN